ncbi:hypothetical protein BACCAP_02798 [Pseudoflavonifractor capillosus ATCC 29799]|uniref:Uncharacterized protein n=1 Tax=Pseudoflavonifractor capillosus ATCC 29799 TaxID=411467 RepID=A6NX54_9FIRM|nr:hypothetical protein BACCAP_02798 [Pseudoflavonifractor capillosus ATCC 29799]
MQGNASPKHKIGWENRIAALVTAPYFTTRSYLMSM